MPSAHTLQSVLDRHSCHPQRHRTRSRGIDWDPLLTRSNRGFILVYDLRTGVQAEVTVHPQKETGAGAQLISCFYPV